MAEATAKGLATGERTALWDNLKAHALSWAKEDLGIAREFRAGEQEAYDLYMRDDEVGDY